MTAVAAPQTGAARILCNTDGLERADWLEKRKAGIGGSDAAAICGLDRYRSPFEVWLEKSHAPLPDEDSEPALWGRLLEGPVREEAARRTSTSIEPAPYILQHPTRDHMLADVDGLASLAVGAALTELGHHGVYEGKTAGVWTAEGWEDNSIPDAYLIQGQHYLAVTGFGWALYGVLIGGQRLELRWVKRDVELIDHLLTIEDEFWQRVVDDHPPAPDGSKSCTELIAHLYDVKPGAILAVDRDEVLPLLEQRAEAKAEAKAAEFRADEAQNRLAVLLGEHEIAVDENGQTLFTRKQVPESQVPATTRKAHRRFHVPKGVLA